MLRPGVSKGLKDNSPTPRAFYDLLDSEFHFDFDPNPINPEGLRESDAFGDWSKRNFCNPPYSKKRKWITKAIEEQNKGNLTVMLLPVDTSCSWFVDLVMPRADIRFVRGRLKLDNGNHPVYASMLAIFNPYNQSHGNFSIQEQRIPEADHSDNVVIR